MLINDNIPEVERLIQEGYDPAGMVTESPNKVSWLMDAAYWGAEASLDLLLKYKADVHYRDANGNNALHHLGRFITSNSIKDFPTYEVSAEKYLRMAAMLVCHGANFKTINNEGDSAFSVPEKLFNVNEVRLRRLYAIASMIPSSETMLVPPAKPSKSL